MYPGYNKLLSNEFSILVTYLLIRKVPNISTIILRKRHRITPRQLPSPRE